MESPNVTCPNCGCAMSQIPDTNWQPTGLVDSVTNRKRQWMWKCLHCRQEEPGNRELAQFVGDADLERANGCLRSGDWQEAIKPYERVLAKYPQSANAWIGKGLAETALGLVKSDSAQATQHLKSAEECFGKPRHSSYAICIWDRRDGEPTHRTDTGFSIPCESEFYHSMIARLPAAPDSDIVDGLVNALLGFCGGMYWNLDLLPEISSRLLIRDEFYYALARHLKPRLETDPEKKSRVSDVLRKLAIWAAYTGEWDKVFHYNAIRTDPILQVQRWVERYVSWSGYWEHMKPLRAGELRGTAIVVRAMVRDRIGALLVGRGIDDIRPIWVDYTREYRFRQTPRDLDYENSFTQRHPATSDRTPADAAPLVPRAGVWECTETLTKPSIEIESLEQWGRHATEFDAHKEELLWLAPRARGGELLTSEQAQTLVARIRELGERGILSPIEVAGALHEYEQREAAATFLQEQLDRGNITWQTVREKFDSYRWSLKNPRKG